VANLTKVVWKAAIPFNEYIGYDKFWNNRGNGRYLRTSNSLSTSITCTEDAPFAGRYDGTPSEINYLETKYLEPGAINTNDPIFNISLPLGMLKDSIFAIDKDLFFGEVITLKIIWNQHELHLIVQMSQIQH